MNHATFRTAWRMAPFLDACAAAGMSRVSVWGDEIAMLGAQRAARLLRDAGLGVFGYNRAGPFLSDDPAERRDLIHRAKAEITQAGALGADHVLAFPGAVPEGHKGLGAALDQTAETCAVLSETAREAGLSLALEPLHPMLAGTRATLCTMGQANALLAQLGPEAGVVVDAWQVWWDPDLPAQLARAGTRILAFHANDWLVPTRDMLNDRGMMGDGIIDLAGMWRQVRAAGYGGPIEVEIFSDRWWAEDPQTVLRIALERCAEIFTDA